MLSNTKGAVTAKSHPPKLLELVKWCVQSSRRQEITCVRLQTNTSKAGGLKATNDKIVNGVLSNVSLSFISVTILTLTTATFHYLLVFFCYEIIK